MNRNDRLYKYAEKEGDFDPNSWIGNTFYGNDNFEKFKIDGCEILREYEPFQMLNIVDLVCEWFDKKNKHECETKPNEVLITLPKTLFSLDVYIEKELDSQGFRCSEHISEGIGFKEGYKLCFSNGNPLYSFIWGEEYKETIFIMFREKDMKKIHNYFFTSELFVARSNAGWA